MRRCCCNKPSSKSSAAPPGRWPRPRGRRLDRPGFGADILNVAVMENTSAKLMVAVFDRMVCVQISGRADFACSVDLKKLITELWERGYAHFIFDLCGCRMMDSTFLGVLAGISLALFHAASLHAKPA